MAFDYPSNVAKRLAELFHASQEKDEGGAKPIRRGASPVPTDDNLRLLLETVYHASLRVEEGRQLFIRLLYIPPRAYEKDPSGVVNVNLHRQHPYRFNPPRPLTETELLRLVPAIDPFQSLLVVCSDEDLPNPTGKDPLVIWGVLKQGFEWWRHVTGRQSGAGCPPNYLTITSQASGQITVTSCGHVLVRLINGHILGMPLGDISQGKVGAFLKQSSDELYLDIVKKLNVQEYDQITDADLAPHHQYYRVLSNIVNLAHEKRHGATFVVFSNTTKDLDQGLRDKINLKYEINGPNIWDTLINQSEASYRYHRLFARLVPIADPTDTTAGKLKEPTRWQAFPLLEQADAKPAELKELIRWKDRLDWAEKELREYGNFVASLSAVDGCVVLTAKLRVLGFGGEIRSQSPDLLRVKVAHDPYGHEVHDELISFHGTRHRSAFRICADVKDCVAFVLSQDGGIKATKKVGSNVMLWPNVNMGDIDL